MPVGQTLTVDIVPIRTPPSPVTTQPGRRNCSSKGPKPASRPSTFLGCVRLGGAIDRPSVGRPPRCGAFGPGPTQPLRDVCFSTKAQITGTGRSLSRCLSTSSGERFVPAAVAGHRQMSTPVGLIVRMVGAAARSRPKQPQKGLRFQHLRSGRSARREKKPPRRRPSAVVDR